MGFSEPDHFPWTSLKKEKQDHEIKWEVLRDFGQISVPAIPLNIDVKYSDLHFHKELFVDAQQMRTLVLPIFP